jgi:hypothetical protein
MPWRTEPEIPAERQVYLTDRRAIAPNIQQDVYPFKGVEPKLTCADIEWLLATHESNGQLGPIDPDDSTQRKRAGLDLRGATLDGVDLSSLPLARLQGGLPVDDRCRAMEHQHQMASLHMAGATLSHSNLAGALLTNCHLEGAALHEVNFAGAGLYAAHFEARDGSKTQQ